MTRLGPSQAPRSSCLCQNDGLRTNSNRPPMKPLLPFPIPLNIGTDICRISRIYGILNSPRATRFVQRILAPDEKSRGDPRLRVLRQARESLESARKELQSQDHGKIEAEDPELWKCATFVAGRFAAKEAAIKAHPQRRLTFHDVLIERRVVEGERLGSGPPVARIRGEGTADASALVSISHDGDYATAVCLGWEGA